MNGNEFRPWSGRAVTDANRLVAQVGRDNGLPCCICGEPIDYDLSATEPRGCTTQHLVSRKMRPDLAWDPANWAPAHRSCNTSEGGRVAALGREQLRSSLTTGQF